LIRIWGFWAWQSEFRWEPTEEQIAAARQASGLHLLEIENGKLMKTHDGLMLDFSAIAKGYAVDRMAAAIVAADCENFVIEFGGDLLARGHAPGKNGWTVDGPALERPVTLINEAIATSGSRHQSRGGMSHVIDPLLGRPVRIDLAVSARASTCAEADALATAQLVKIASK
jgi:thiamine biosynthesis lipoprotein